MIVVFKKILGIIIIINKVFGDFLKMVLFILDLGIIVNLLVYIFVERNKIIYV